MSELDVEAEVLQKTDVECGPIGSVDLFEDGQERRLVLHCEQGALTIETSLSHRWIRVHLWLN
jgi:hypothetical protein